MAFRKKAATILVYKPDILIVQECEHPDKLIFESDTLKPTAALWFGKNQHKGLGIFTYASFKLKVHRLYNEAFKWIIPVNVSNGTHSFILYAIWANNPEDADGQYVTQVWKALQYYNRHIHKKNTILIGDFNSNTIWDQPKRKGNHSHVVAQLKKKNIHSVYHHYFCEEQGKELQPSFYLYRHKNKPYHLDYCFVSSNLLEQLSTVEMGKHKKWTNHSDHVPLIATFNMENV
jgi:exodeoxyribonuclease III